MKTIYHVSKTPNLKVLEPKLCSHSKAYVYASYNLETALLFGGELWSDWDFIYKRNYESGLLTFSETYPDIFNKTFKGKSCIIYEVEDDGFKQGQTNMWDEIVSENPVKVLSERKVDDIAKELEKFEKLGKIKIEKYENTDEYKQKVEKHILNLRKYSDINHQHNTPVLLKHFGKLVNKK